MLTVRTRPARRRIPRIRRWVAPAVSVVAILAVTAACSAASSSSSSSGASSSAGRGSVAAAKQIAAVGAENQYGNVISQVGGQYVAVTSVMSNPSTDPHAYQASPRTAQDVSGAQLIVQNGLGYDGFMNSIEDAQPSSVRQVIVVQHLLGLPDSTPNPHLWYLPGTMAKVAGAVASALTRLDPGHASYFLANAGKFAASQQSVITAIGSFASGHPNVPVATTEPVADYLLTALGATNLTPWAFQADIMNGTDPAAQDIATERALFTEHKVRVFLYNQQVTSTLTQSFIQLAQQNGIPVVGVYETMPAPGYDYQSWMLAEVSAITKAVSDKVSTEHL